MGYTLTVSGTTFELKQVNLRIRDMYGTMTDLVADLSMLTDEAADIADQVEIDAEAAGTLAAKAKVRRAARVKMRGIDKKRREYTGKIVEHRGKILAAILEKNGYEYDGDWWDEYADINDVNGLIVGIMQGGDAGK